MTFNATTIDPRSGGARETGPQSRRMERAFWIVSLLILVSDGIFIFVNHLATQQSLYDNLAEEGARREAIYYLNLRSQGLHMQQFATYLANQPEVRALFLAGRQAVVDEGGGAGGERAARLRQRLYDQVSPGWRRLAGDFKVRQLHFHLGPGDTSFLRVHSPAKFGDDLSPIRHTITHAIRDNKATHGFESGRVYPGIRGVAPIAVTDPATGAQTVLGALEAGSSFTGMLNTLEADMSTAYSVLMTREYFSTTHWPDFAARRVAERPLVGDWFIEATSDERLLRAMLEQPEVMDALGARRPVIVRAFGGAYAVYSFPFRDFLRLVEPEQAPIGAIVSWKNADALLAAADASLKTNLMMGVIAFLVIETLLFTAWTLTRGRLQRVIDDKVSQLSATNRTLRLEVSRRERVEQQLIEQQGQLEAKVGERTRSLQETVVTLEQEMDRRHAVERTLQRERDQAQITLRSIVDGVITTDADCRVRYMNPAAEELTGWQIDEAQGRDLQEVFRARDLEAAGAALNYASCLRGRCERQHGENTELTRRDGEVLTVEHSLSPIRDTHDQRTGLVLVFHDDTEARELATQLSFQASHDALTGLLNRRAIEFELNDALRGARLHDGMHAFLYIDLDQFKVVNDTCGHVAGDELLRQLPKLLQQNTRHSDSLARLGGDEFGLLLRDCPPDKARRIADGLLQNLQTFRFVWNERSFRVGASIGVAVIDAHSEGVEAILSAADAACYLAKDRGRSRVQLFLPADDELLSRRGEMQWVSRIQLALAEDRLLLFGQPIVPVAPDSQAPVRQEILVRMVDEQGELIPPTAFIPAAERYGMMPEIDRWIIARTFRLIRHMRSHWPEMAGSAFNINLSGDTMADEGILDFIRAQFREHAVDPGAICFEVTETAAIANLSRAIDLMSELRDLGCRFALDDFGSGLSSFGYLKALPVDFLKIDGGFVRHLDVEPIDRVMVKSINEVGHAMGLKTIAEFVENDRVMHELRQLGVDYAQGFSLGRPVSLL